jgi:hypothetical protein
VLERTLCSSGNKNYSSNHVWSVFEHVSIRGANAVRAWSTQVPVCVRHEPVQGSCVMSVVARIGMILRQFADRQELISSGPRVEMCMFWLLSVILGANTFTHAQRLETRSNDIWTWNSLCAHSPSHTVRLIGWGDLSAILTCTLGRNCLEFAVAPSTLVSCWSGASDHPCRLIGRIYKFLKTVLDWDRHYFAYWLQ